MTRRSWSSNWQNFLGKWTAKSPQKAVRRQGEARNDRQEGETTSRGQVRWGRQFKQQRVTKDRIDQNNNMRGKYREPLGESAWENRKEESAL